MKRYIVEMRNSYNDDFDNWINDYTFADTKEEALDFAMQWLIDNGMEPEEVEDLDYMIREAA